MFLLFLPLLLTSFLLLIPHPLISFRPHPHLVTLWLSTSARTTLLIARWSGARRGEIRRLEVDCLDSYPDGTPRLRIPAGKTYQERVIPIHEEAAAADYDVADLSGSLRSAAKSE